MVAFFPNWKGQRIKIGKWLTILTILLLCVFQLYTLSEIYQNTKKDYSNNIFSILVAKTELLNLIKLPSPPQTYYSYNANRHKLRIIKENERIDSIFKLEPNRDFRLVNCQASYDIRDTNIWTLDTLGKMLVTALESQNLSTYFNLTLSDKHSDILATFQHGKLYLPFLNIHKELQLGFLEHHKLKVTFAYPFHIFWNAAWDRTITTVFLFLLLIVSSMSLFVQLRDERRTSEYRKKFTHTLVHNLRSPLLAAKQQLTAFETLKFSAEKQQQIIQVCIQNTTNVLKDIEKLLFTSVNAYGLVAHREIFDLNQTIQKLIPVYQQNYPDKKVHICIDCQICCLVDADPTLIEGALGNLIGNAIKYSGPEVHIHIICRKNPHKVFISVQDDGFGIPPNEQQYIFQENYRGKQYKNDRSHRGFGLGLFYVQAVVLAHRGKISVNSDGANGTTFTIELPQK